MNNYSGGAKKEYEFQLEELEKYALRAKKAITSIIDQTITYIVNTAGTLKKAIIEVEIESQTINLEERIIMRKWMEDIIKEKESEDG